jgi:hypothetical protein
LLHHDIFVCTEIPSFVAPRYFLTCTNSFRSNFSNTMLCGAGLGCTDVGIPQNVGRCTDVEITPPSPRPPPARVRRRFVFLYNFMSLLS